MKKCLPDHDRSQEICLTSDDGIQRLLEIMRRLRDKDDGCPWDLEQDFATLAPFLLEEAYEVVDAVEFQQWANLEEELGDLLFEIVFFAQLAKEEGLFDLNSIAHGAADKMVRRHPHIFADAKKVLTAEQQRLNWENSKEAEGAGTKGSIAGRLTWGLPALALASKVHKYDSTVSDLKWLTQSLIAVQDRAQGVGKEESELWPETSDVSALVGALLYELTRVAGSLSVDPEQALRKFLRSKVDGLDTQNEPAGMIS